MRRMPFPESIQTERLLLRRFIPDDLGAMTAIWSDPDVQASLRPDERFDPATAAQESLDRRLDNWETDGFSLFAAAERESGEVIGWAGAWLQDLSRAHTGEVEVGWTLRRPWWGRGLATEAASASAEAAFTHLDVERVISLIHPSNERSVAVARRLGMEPDGTARHKDLPDLQLLVYSLPRSSFSASPQSRSSR